MTKQEWNETIMEIRRMNACFANYHIQKTIPVRYEEGEGLEELVEHPLKKGHYVWIPF